MTERFNIIIASENGGIRTFIISGKKLFFTFILSILVITVLSFSSLFTVGFSLRNTYLMHRMALLKKDKQETDRINTGFEARLANMIQDHKDEVAQLKARNEQLVTNLQLKSSHLIADLKMQNLQQEAAFKEEKEHLMSTAVSELRERSELIANVMNHIGVKLKKFKRSDVSPNSGGPFIAIEDNRYNQLLYKADQYLKTLKTLPLGQPIHGDINSPYGPRIDPITHTAAFHPGIDIAGYVGEKVRATAEGTVVTAERNGGYGKYILIDHGNGYSTGYGHLSRFRVDKGEHVSRGQIIGYVGNTGRSTGAHLHYEISIHNKTIDPYKFFNFVDISRSIVTKKRD
jgi:murein DD-endopeptidase MepM/ murein hydrolase activator NlpD